jgi:DNA-binding response OmpR family regulator
MAKILIVDDDHEFVGAVRTVLENSGHQVAAAYSRESGMEASQKEDPDLFIIDVMMEQPDDGFTMAQDLRKQGIDKPILMLTGISQVTGMEFDKDSDIVPVDAFVNKPVLPGELLKKVNELLKR